MHLNSFSSFQLIFLCARIRFNSISLALTKAAFELLQSIVLHWAHSIYAFSFPIDVQRTEIERTCGCGGCGRRAIGTCAVFVAVAHRTLHNQEWMCNALGVFSVANTQQFMFLLKESTCYSGHCALLHLGCLVATKSIFAHAVVATFSSSRSQNVVSASLNEKLIFALQMRTIWSANISVICFHFLFSVSIFGTVVQSVLAIQL